MKKNDILKIVKTANKFVDKNRPAILTGTALVGLFITAVSIYKAAPKAEKILEKRKEEIKKLKKEDKRRKREITKKTVKEIVPIMFPPIIFGVGTAVCVVGSHSASNRKIAALTAAYNISEKALTELNGKIKDTLGDTKVKAIKDSIVKDKIGNAPKNENGTPIFLGVNNVLCKDLYTGRFFPSNMEKIKSAVNELSYNLQGEMYVSLNDFYDLLGIDRIPVGDDIGWNVDDSDRGRVPISCTSVLTDDGVPCIAIDYDVRLLRDFRNLH